MFDQKVENLEGKFTPRRRRRGEQRLPREQAPVQSRAQGLH